MIEKEPKFHWQILECSDWNLVLIPLHEAKSLRNQSMYKYRIYLQWSHLPEPTGTKTSHVSLYGDHEADAGIFLKDNTLLQVKRDALGK